MPKMDKDAQKQTADAPDSGFPVWPEMAVHARLKDVKVSDQPGGSGYHYWTWEYEVVEDREVTAQVPVTKDGKTEMQPQERSVQGQKFWNNTSLSPQAAFSMKATYDAHNAEYDSDTDDLLGDVVKLIIGVRTIQSGDRKGELANQITRVVPKDEDFEAPEAVAAGVQPNVDDIM